MALRPYFDDREEEKSHEDMVDHYLSEIEAGQHNKKLMIAKAYAPYDGCFWEWVYAFIHDGKILWAHDPRKYGNYQWHKTDTDREVLLNLSNIDFMANDELEIPGASVRGLYKMAEEFNIDWFRYRCSNCDKHFEWSEDIYYLESGYHSLGGVVISAGEPVCEDCEGELEAQEFIDDLKREFEDSEFKVEKYMDLAYDRLRSSYEYDWNLIQEVKNSVYVKRVEGIPNCFEDCEDKTLWAEFSNQHYRQFNNSETCDICRDDITSGYYNHDRNEHVCPNHVVVEGVIEDERQMKLNL